MPETWKKKKPLIVFASCLHARSSTDQAVSALNGRIPTLLLGVAFFSSIGGCRFVITAVLPDMTHASSLLGLHHCLHRRRDWPPSPPLSSRVIQIRSFMHVPPLDGPLLSSSIRFAVCYRTGLWMLSIVHQSSGCGVWSCQSISKCPIECNQ